MTVIDDLKTAIDAYETDKVKTEILGLAHPGTALNVGEVFTYNVKVTNQGYLDMKNVKVRAIATEFADVAVGVGAFGGHAISAAFNLDAGQSYTVTTFKGKAKKATGGKKKIVTARIDAWDASLEHLLLDQTGAGQPEGELPADIIPS